MNQRDERGWRIPRDGTKSRQIYDLLVAEFSSGEIIELFQGNRIATCVLIHNIKNPESQNMRANRYYRTNSEKLNSKKKNERREKGRGNYSKYVCKLVRNLGISYTEAVAEERKLLEKMK